MPVLAHKKREPHKPSAPNAQTALVVGLDGEVLTTDRDHRVKVQFAWQRGLQPNAGGLAWAHVHLGRQEQPIRQRAVRHLGARGAASRWRELGRGLHAAHRHRSRDRVCGRRHRSAHRARCSLQRRGHTAPFRSPSACRPHGAPIAIAVANPAHRQSCFLHGRRPAS